MNIDLEKYNIPADESIVVGVSAGPDSMALLHYLMKNSKYNIICAHINHNVRKQSKYEEMYLKKFCQENNITFEVTHLDNYTENNFEAEARKKRYAFYEKILNKYNSKYLFLAHHGDDLIETVLMKIARGSNIEGYAGIKEISFYKNSFYIIRPLLKYDKKNIINYLKENKIKYYIDKTNKSSKYTRNRYRKKILPILKKEDINIHMKFLKYSKLLLEYDSYIKEETKKILKKIYSNKVLDINSFKLQHAFMQKNILFYILNNIYDNNSDIISNRHIDNIINLINSNKKNAVLNIPKNVIVKKEYNKLIFTKKELNNINDTYKVEFTKEFEYDDFYITKINETDKDGNDICRLNTDEINLPLYVRNKKNGDYINVRGMDGSKKVKEIFIEKKIPINKRNIYPILIDDKDNVLWVPNLKKSKFVKKKNEKYDIILRYYEREEK